MLRTLSRAASALNSGQRRSWRVSSIRNMAGDPGAAPPTRGPQRGRCRAPHLGFGTSAAGIDFDDVTDYLERDGLDKFEKSWSELGATVAAELERQHHHTTR
jgi:hypothetical protein